MERIILLTGGFGSGKSEIALNLATDFVTREPTTFVDLDIANPYFRSRDARDFLTNQGIKAVVPREEWLNADLPILSPGLVHLIRKAPERVIFDIGGDEIGATVLGSLWAEFQKTPYSLFMVVNPYRPFTRNVEMISFMHQEIQRASRLNIQGLISNPNLGPNTELEHVLAGHKIVEQTAEKLNIPVIALGILARKAVDWEKSLNAEIDPAIQRLPLHIHLMPEWLTRNN